MAKTAELAEQMQRAGEGIKALVSIAAAKRDADEKARAAANLMQTLKIDRAERNVTIDWQVPEAKLLEIIRAGALADEKRGTSTTPATGR